MWFIAHAVVQVTVFHRNSVSQKCWDGTFILIIMLGLILYPLVSTFLCAQYKLMEVRGYDLLTFYCNIMLEPE